MEQPISAILEQVPGTIPQAHIQKETGKRKALPTSREYFEAFKLIAKKKEFDIDSDNENVIKTVCRYFAKEEQDGISLKKGLFIFGAVGCGKTTLMEIFSGFARETPARFQIISTRELAAIFSKEGFKGIEMYGKRSYVTESSGYNSSLQYSKPIHRCFDDFGLEENSSKYYGSSCNVMAEIILDRYDGWRKNNQLTHLTSNIKSGPQIEAAYGDRVRSRMREMFNFIELPGGDRRK